MKYRFTFFFIYLVSCCAAQSSYELQEQKADSLSIMEHYQAANTIYKKLQKNFFTSKKYNDFVRIRIKTSLNYQQDGDFDASIPILKDAIAHRSKGIISDSLIGLAYHKLGVAYFQIADDTEAIKNWELALDFRKKAFLENHLDIIKTYRNIGSSNLYLERYETAAFYLRKSLDLHLPKVDKDSFLLAQTYQDLSLALSNLETFKLAESYLTTTLNIYDKVAPKRYWLQSEVYENFYALYEKQLNYPKMLYYAKASAKIYESLPNKTVDDFEFLANAYHNLGLAYELMDSLEFAIFHFQQSIQLNKTIPKLSKSSLANNYSNVAIVYRKLGDFSQALYYINKAIGINNSLDKKLDLARNYNNKALILKNLGEINNALSFNQEALTNIVLSFSYNTLYENPTISDLTITTKPHFAKILNDKANILYLKYQEEQNKEILEAAVSTYDSIISLTNQIRLNLESDESKFFLTTKAQPIFQAAIIANAALYQLTKSEALFDKLFQLTEQSKSMIILDALVENDAAQNAGIPIAILEREKKLKEQINVLEKKLQFDQTSTDKTPLIIASRQLELLIDSLHRDYPKYAQIKYANKIIHPDALDLKPEQTLLSYFIGEKEIYVLLIGASGKQLIEIPITLPLLEKTQQFQRSLLTYHLQHLHSDMKYNAYADTLVVTSNQLYEQLFAPILEKYTLSRALIIVPDGVLGYLPFELLLKDTVANPSAFGLHPYLIHDYQISYAYSATLWQEMRAKKYPSERENLIAFAPFFPGKKIAEHRTIQDIKSALSPLIHNVPEVQAIADIINGRIFTNHNATKKQFLDKATNYKIIHLSTHGKANDQIGDYAYLAFSPIQGVPENEILFNRDLYNLQLQTDMVVLSACETGIGELQKGEGIISLARGFAYAGAKSIITTLWSINDQTSIEIMSSFYTYIKAGQTKDAALRQAKLDFISNHPHLEVHPFYWSAFIPIGDMQALDLQNKDSWKMSWIIIAFCILLIGGKYLIFLLNNSTKS